jgi:hypothetical protein
MFPSKAAGQLVSHSADFCKPVPPSPEVLGHRVESLTRVSAQQSAD